MKFDSFIILVDFIILDDIESPTNITQQSLESELINSKTDLLLTDVNK